MQASGGTPLRQHTTMWWVMRGVWGFLTLIHLWPFALLACRLCTAPSVGDVFWQLSLVAVIGLFGLKAVDSPRLRFQRPGLELLAFVIVASLIHGDVAPGRNLPALSVEAAVTVVAAAGVAAVSDRRLRRRLADWLRGLAGGRSDFGRGLRPFEVLPNAAWRCPGGLVLRFAPARAPPL